MEPGGNHGQVHTVIVQDREVLLDVDLPGVGILEAIKQVGEPLGYGAPSMSVGLSGLAFLQGGRRSWNSTSRTKLS